MALEQHRNLAFQKKISEVRSTFVKRMEKAPVQTEDDLQSTNTVDKFKEVISQYRVNAKLEHKQAAAELRMDAVIANAQLIELIITSLNSNPDITLEDLIKKIEKSNKLLYPQLTQKFVYILMSRVDMVKKILKRKENTLAANDIFRALFSSDNPLNAVNNTAELVECPIAVTLLLSEEDFSKVDTRTNINGFFQSFRTFNIKASEHTTGFLSAPLIIAKKTQVNVINHENVHAENDNVRSALGNEKHFVIWGSWQSDVPAKEATEKLLEQTKDVTLLQNKYQRITTNIREKTLGLWPKETAFSNQVAEKIAQTKEFQQLISFGLSRAKEEILAEMNWKYGSGKNYLSVITKQGGIYDYFVNRLNIPENSILHETLWREYVNQLNEHTKHAYRIYAEYKSNPVWQHRLRIFRLILLQWPVEQWNKQLESSGFLEEITLFEEIKGDTVGLDNLLVSGKITPETLTQEESEIRNLVIDAYNSVCTQIITNSQTSQIQFLKHKIGFIKSVIKKTYDGSTLSDKMRLYYDIQTVFSKTRNILLTLENKKLSAEKREVMYKLVDSSLEIITNLYIFLDQKNLISIERLQKDYNTLQNNYLQIHNL